MDKVIVSVFVGIFCWILSVVLLFLLFVVFDVVAPYCYWVSDYCAWFVNYYPTDNDMWDIIALDIVISFGIGILAAVVASLRRREAMRTFGKTVSATGAFLVLGTALIFHPTALGLLIIFGGALICVLGLTSWGISIRMKNRKDRSSPHYLLPD